MNLEVLAQDGHSASEADLLKRTLREGAVFASETLFQTGKEESHQTKETGLPHVATA